MGGTTNQARIRGVAINGRLRPALNGKVTLGMRPQPIRGQAISGHRRRARSGRVTRGPRKILSGQAISGLPRPALNGKATLGMRPQLIRGQVISGRLRRVRSGKEIRGTVKISRRMAGQVVIGLNRIQILRTGINLNRLEVNRPELKHRPEAGRRLITGSTDIREVVAIVGVYVAE